MAGVTPFNRWLKQRRKELGLTQRDLAGYISCAEITILKIEAGERRPSRQIAEQLAAVFDIPKDERLAFVRFARSKAPPSLVAAELSPPAGAPWRTHYFQQTNLPTILTSLVGREQAVRDIQNLLLQKQVRLLTLTGPPGIGKTRLALQVAVDALEHFEDGVFWVDLAPTRDPGAVISTIARSIGVTEAEGMPLTARLVQHVREKRMLLLLDNFEQVLPAAEYVVALLKASPWLKVLLTSRETLSLLSGRQFQVAPLQLPDLAQLANVASVAQSPAVALFVERAQAIKPRFALTQKNVTDVAEICINLDGLPLAIELAAARVATHTPHQIRVALANNGLEVLAAELYDLPPRQQTLYTAIDWSYNLLHSAEQQLFVRLGIFMGSWSLDAAKAVCNASEDLIIPALEGLEGLIKKNLVLQQEAPSADDDNPRFGMLETIREYARERLRASGVVAPLQQQYADYYLWLAEQAAPELTGAQQQIWLQRLADEYDNLHAVLDWAKESRQPDLSLRLAAALWRFWYVRGYFSEGRAWLEDALAGSTESGQRAIRATVLKGIGSLAKEQGDYTDAWRYFEQSLALMRAEDDKRGVATLLNNLGVVAYEQSKFTTASRLLQESLAIQRELGNEQGMADALNNLGITAMFQGAYAAAEAFYTESMGLREKLGDTRGYAAVLSNLGIVVKERGDYAVARSYYERSLAIEQELGDQWSIANSLINLAEIAELVEDYTRASALYSQSQSMCQALGDKRGIAIALCGNGRLTYKKRDYPQAAELFVKSLELYKDQENKRGIAACLAGLGGVAVAEGEAHRAARLLGAVDSLLKSTKGALDAADQLAYDQHVASTRAQLEAAAFATAWAAGQAMPLDEAISELV
jgi:predicted ATPase/transcriptional regulator with XRE-family HTH domain